MHITRLDDVKCKHLISGKVGLKRVHKKMSQYYGTPEGTFLFQYLPEKKSKQKELERK